MTRVPFFTTAEMTIVLIVAWVVSKVFEPRGTWIEDIMKEKYAATGSTEFDSHDVLAYMREHEEMWSDIGSLMRNGIQNGTINEQTDPAFVEDLILEEINRLLKSMRNGGNGKSTNKKAAIAAIPLDWSKPHICPEGYKLSRYCSREEFEKRAIEAMGEEAFGSWREEYSKIIPKAGRRSKDSYEIGGARMLSETSGVVELYDSDTQTMVEELKIDIGAEFMDIRGPEDLGAETVKKAAQRLASWKDMPQDLEEPEKVVMFRVRFKSVKDDGASNQKASI